ncbi:biotin--[acetyl-CoA-carboxylase] ligase [Lentibacillus cibarius]|uniref:Bifunctional ligase/repressor BirA n=1 Tax=Lentibacillus cibarius TaxID=2583219 RepID=A0A5S3QP80_9BACI|nr:biotin--[acetyl-CoA-carboxylase] ligase [Lentibacillus cibarius]TMN23720.1 biotin--[acetyl-CoA-carboxylase] ligase [Lentibacillus cibarius]
MTSTRYRLLELLNTNGNNYISGQKLSEELNISRSAIWKHMKDLEKDGYVIEGVRRKGYRIVQSPDKVSENTIRWGLGTDWLGKNVIHKEVADSTQSIAHKEALHGAPHGTVIVADEQTEGKGRMNRQWHSASNKGIWMSIILRPNMNPGSAPQLTLMTAVAIAEALSENISAKPKIKWPNDILIHHKKTAGILTEMQAEQDCIKYVVIGIGININQTEADFPSELKNFKATSIRLETDVYFHVKDIIQKILLRLEQVYDGYMQTGFTDIKTKWEHYGYKIGEDIRIKTLRHSFNATFLGIAADGALLAQMENNETKKIYSGEIEWFHDGRDKC